MSNTGYKDPSGNDLIQVFSPYVSGTKTITNYKSNNNDLSNIFQPGGQYSNLYYRDTGYNVINSQSVSVDLSSLFELNLIDTRTSGATTATYTLLSWYNGVIIKIIGSGKITFNYGLNSIDCILVAGGGGGGGTTQLNAGGGGGAGEVGIGPISIPKGTVTFTIGNGGTGGVATTSGGGGAGGNTSISYGSTSYTSNGGGGGGNGKGNGGSGGSGGGGGSWSHSGGGGGGVVFTSGLSAKYGNIGGTGENQRNDSGQGGGGGGASGAGQAGENTTTSGDGGSGITVTSYPLGPIIGYIGGGGGGGANQLNNFGSGGIVSGQTIGGRGGYSNNVPLSGQANTGSGGGGGQNTVNGNNNQNGASGGSGVCYLRIANGQVLF